jgi:bifunctional DNA-binding transcriptional regulator/antitoxin component of YhaV-PrlF toxin-antitoxin module
VSEENIILLRDKGVITLPVNLRRKYDLRPGDVLALSDLGEGALMITTRASRLAALGNQAAEIVQAEGMTLDEILQGLDEERERYYREHYVDG